jgi:mannose-6-phosphate isomerase
MLYPLTFQPILKHRIWGGRNLADLYGKALPQNTPIGESWEVSDRPGDESVISNGPLAGQTLHWLMQNHRRELFGAGNIAENLNRFPLLVKIIDAQQTLSVQVHPPASIASQLGGEPKTEMWYVARAEPGAELFVGLKRGVTRDLFERKLAEGRVEECVHRIGVKAGDVMFLPSGRIHALGAGIVIFEIQQNSDTTYRVFDWNRVDANGRPRELHVARSLASTDFNDFEPSLVRTEFTNEGQGRIAPLAHNDLFCVDIVELPADVRREMPGGELRIIGVLNGSLSVLHETGVSLKAGEFCLLPASLEGVTLQATMPVSFLEIRAGEATTAG